MELDLTRLNSLAFMDFQEITQAEKPPIKPTEPLNGGGESKTAQEQEKPVERLTEGLGRLQREADAKKQEIDRSLAIYREYQQNIKTSGQLQTDIIKGAKAGEDIYSLFLKAVQAISLMASNKLFYSLLEADIKTIYGAGLLQPQPLRMELNAVQERLTRLRDALQREGEPEDSRQRIKSAIKAHEAEAERLQGLIEQ